MTGNALYADVSTLLATAALIDLFEPCCGNVQLPGHNFAYRWKKTFLNMTCRKKLCEVCMQLYLQREDEGIMLFANYVIKVSTKCLAEFTFIGCLLVK